LAYRKSRRRGGCRSRSLSSGLEGHAHLRGGKPARLDSDDRAQLRLRLLRKNRSRDLVSFDDLEGAELASAESGGDLKTSFASTPEAELISRADAEALTAGIDSLPPEFREVLVLRDIQGLNYQEIAQVTSVPLGTVMSRLARARRRLITLIRGPLGASKAGPSSATRNEKEQVKAETGSAGRR
jgi:RNA polymerase sigma factor (sigma-70 family)